MKEKHYIHWLANNTFNRYRYWYGTWLWNRYRYTLKEFKKKTLYFVSIK